MTWHWHPIWVPVWISVGSLPIQFLLMCLGKQRMAQVPGSAASTWGPWIPGCRLGFIPAQGYYSHLESKPVNRFLSVSPSLSHSLNFPCHINKHILKTKLKSLCRSSRAPAIAKMAHHTGLTGGFLGHHEMLFYIMPVCTFHINGNHPKCLDSYR